MENHHEEEDQRLTRDYSVCYYYRVRFDGRGQTV